jgi:phage-related protein
MRPEKFTLLLFARGWADHLQAFEMGDSSQPSKFGRAFAPSSLTFAPSSRRVYEFMKKPCVYLKQYSALLALASLLWIVPSVSSQEVPPHTAPPSPPTDITRQELASFDSFLDSHPEMGEQLRRNPSLVDDREYVKNHPELQAFLQDHPGVREELTENPRAFMRDENRYDRRDRDDDANRRELANFDSFLDKHPEIAEQLRKNPSLADNREFLQNHPALQQFMQEHPGVRQQLAQDPQVFMRQEDRFDRRDRDNDATRRELANFDAFLDKHPETAEQLRKNPTLSDNKEFLQNHPALQQFLQEHSGVREQLAQDPRVFMRQENRYDRRDDDTNRRELASFDGFLDSHPEISRQLSKDPSLAKNEEYLENHPELREYLKTHTGVQQQLAQNPQAFMNSMKQYDNSGATKKQQMVEPKPKP